MSAIIGFVLVFAACSEDGIHKPLGGGNSSAPGKVKNVQVHNISGGAIITYELPGDVDLQYVKAVYESATERREAKVSTYVNTLTIEGFGNTEARKVQIYAVNKMEKMSEPEEVTVNPLAPPVLLVKESLTTELVTGGFAVSYENVNKVEVGIVILARDSATTEFVEYDALYTSLAKGRFAVRGLPAKENDFEIYVVDKWGNISETINLTLTPWREDYLDKKLFRPKEQYGDADWNQQAGSLVQAWDDIIEEWHYAHTAEGVAFPHYMTIDLGVDVQLSRFKIWQRPAAVIYWKHGSPKRYNIYGRADDPGTGNPTDILAGWTLLRECLSVKPSGSPLGTDTDDDVYVAAVAGEEFEFTIDIPTVRYVRFEFLESWTAMKATTFAELAFWGTILE
jgi:hypothetical protein